MKFRIRKWKVSLTVVNDIRGIRGSVTKFVPSWRIKQIIDGAIEEWRDLEAKHVKMKKVGK